MMITTTNEIRAALLRLPLASCNDNRTDLRGDERHVTIETRRGDVVLFQRLEDIGVDATDESTIGIFRGYELTLTHPANITFETWIVDRYDERLFVRHAPGRISSRVAVVRTPRAPIDCAIEIDAASPPPTRAERHLRSAS